MASTRPHQPIVHSPARPLPSARSMSSLTGRGRQPDQRARGQALARVQEQERSSSRGDQQAGVGLSGLDEQEDEGSLPRVRSLRKHLGGLLPFLATPLPPSTSTSTSQRPLATIPSAIISKLTPTSSRVSDSKERKGASQLWRRCARIWQPETSSPRRGTLLELDSTLHGDCESTTRSHQDSFHRSPHHQRTASSPHLAPPFHSPRPTFAPPPISASTISTLSPRPVHLTSSKPISDFTFSSSLQPTSSAFLTPPADSSFAYQPLPTPCAPRLPPDVLDSFGRPWASHKSFLTFTAEDDDARSTRSNNCDSRSPFDLAELEGQPYLGSRFSDATTTTSGQPSTFRQISPVHTPLPEPRITRRVSAPSLFYQSTSQPRPIPPFERPPMPRMLSSSTQTTSDHDSTIRDGSCSTSASSHLPSLSTTTKLSPTLPPTLPSLPSLSEEVTTLLELQLAIEPVVLDAHENNLSTVLAWQAENVRRVEGDKRRKRE